MRLLLKTLVREDIKKKCRKSEKGTIGGEGVRKIIEFSIRYLRDLRDLRYERSKI